MKTRSAPSLRRSEAQPRYATPRSPNRLSLGPEVEKLAEQLGRPLMPWQSHAAHLGLEMIENDAGLLVPAFREVICTVMRQSGKSTLLFSLFAHRATMWAEALCVHGAGWCSCTQETDR